MYGRYLRIALMSCVVGPFLGAGFSVAVWSKPVVPSNGSSLVPHAAVYRMELHSARSSSGIVGASGTMRYTFEDGCTAWKVKTRTDLTLFQSQGDAVSSSWDFLSWESKDGQSYRFSVQNMRDGEVLDAYQGEARMPPAGVGSALFRIEGDQQDVVFDLSPGTLFPAAHTDLLFRQARNGGRFLARPVFDGSIIGPAFDLSAAVGNPFPDQASSVLPGNALLKGGGWPIVMAFFNPANGGGVPDFEVSLRYRNNGIAESLLQNFGTFSLRGTLVELHPPPAPDCAL
ncbi:DUF1849 family protein [Haematospirillum jordaniae]|uniref:Uncharacterized protein n=1 Tax=Haematospirillum jordaniae TaxID=1549855 RepID=A0A143DEC2_9PROT|nr:DUF1849 family protein [Haematospirillum jordaniae]AMW34929.1 hypothetical protein AY555_06755 [Haematospirillum jordaniae]NKD56729.1 DUF1849 family protein [Haematospirillum jordaniae]NKD59115.1 DUF1849 family protein [Haematospirillum jordaniae]NKD67842.1 DUF1849 family protein [Haematospirillum jordaniae]NKD79117.1 DUF1849 family protein [Haematospirillum jordaniae]